MLVWCIILFVMGILAFMDTLFNYGELFRRIDSVVYLLISLGLLVRISMKVKMKRFEGLITKVEQLESELARFRNHLYEQSKSNETECRSGSAPTGDRMVEVLTK